MKQMQNTFAVLFLLLLCLGTPAATLAESYYKGEALFSTRPSDKK